jgi:TRAP-type C4-dicarboxylate transport system permease small subunit
MEQAEIVLCALCLGLIAWRGFQIMSLNMRAEMSKCALALITTSLWSIWRCGGHGQLEMFVGAFAAFFGGLVGKAADANDSW